MTQLMLYVSGGELDAARCRLTVPPPVEKKKGKFRRKDAPKEVSKKTCPVLGS